MSLFLFYIFVCKKAVDLIDRFRFYYVLCLFYRYRSFVCRLCRVRYFSHMVRVAEAAAGKKWHHAYTGGLAQHCLELAKLADAVCTIFPGVDRDILLTGILVHDIGKIEEMSHGMYVDYTTPGKLLGHLVIGADMVQERIRAIEGFPESLRLQVLHCILAHHGELVNGSPIVPKTVEAMVLHQIDNLGAQVDAFLRIVEETKLRGQDWSDYIGLIERPIWTKEGE